VSCNAVHSGRRLPVIRGNSSPPFSGFKSKKSKKAANCWILLGLLFDPVCDGDMFLREVNGTARCYDPVMLVLHAMLQCLSKSTPV
jgi:hypothetical protein